jgi:two-component system OmpR family response regulator
MHLLYIVDDEEDMLQTLEFYFQKAGYEVKTFTKSKDMMESLETQKPNLILMDVNLRRNDGRTICKVIKRKYDSTTPIILFSGNADLETEYKECNADGFINKPFSLEEISKVIASHLQN